MEVVRRKRRCRFMGRKQSLPEAWMGEGRTGKVTCGQEENRDLSRRDF